MGNWWVARRVRAPRGVMAIACALLLGAAGGVSQRPSPLPSPVLMLSYHRFSTLSPDAPAEAHQTTIRPEAFEQQMAWLDEHGFHPITCRELALAFDGQAVLPRHPVAITVDDGWKGARTVALPVLEHHHFRATFFVFFDAIGRPDRLDARDVRALARAGMEIGSHSLSHADLVRLPLEARDAELFESRRRIARLVGRRVTSFAYPFGAYDAELESLAHRAGYALAAAVGPGIIDRAEQRYALPRATISYDETLEAFAARFASLTP